MGGLGYLGARLADALSRERAVCVTSRSLSAQRRRWLEARTDRITWQPFDSAQDEHLPFEQPFDCMLNLAMPSAAEAAADPVQSRERAQRTLRACLAYLERGLVRRLVHFSTFHVYGYAPRSCFTEDDPLHPNSAYGEIHRVCEELLGRSAAAPQRSAAAPILIVRPTNIVGAPAHSDLGPQARLLFLDLCRQAVQEQEIRLRTNGIAYRDFVPMSDAIAAVRRLIAIETKSPVSILNLSWGTALRLDELARAIQETAQNMLGRDIPLRRGSATDPWSTPFHVSNERLRSLGWQPRGVLRKEIEQTLAFFQANI